MKTMRKTIRAVTIGAVILAGFSLEAQEHSAKREAVTIALDCGGGNCQLLKGAPQTSGMWAGSVRLKPGESVGWHSTRESQEALVILRGKGAASIEGHSDVPLQERTLAYIPPATNHNVTNTGTEILEYVWLAAPTK